MEKTNKSILNSPILNSRFSSTQSFISDKSIDPDSSPFYVFNSNNDGTVDLSVDKCDIYGIHNVEFYFRK